MLRTTWVITCVVSMGLCAPGWAEDAKAPAASGGQVVLTTADGGADAELDADWGADKNNGAGDSVAVKNTPHPAGISKAIFAFELTKAKNNKQDVDLSKVTTAGLALDITTAPQFAGVIDDWTYSVYAVKEADDYGAGKLKGDWAEDAVTWQNAPGNNPNSGSGADDDHAVLVGTFETHKGKLEPVVMEPSTKLGELIRNSKGGRLTLIVTRTDADDNLATFAAKEAKKFKPPTLTINQAP